LDVTFQVQVRQAKIVKFGDALQRSRFEINDSNYFQAVENSSGQKRRKRGFVTRPENGP